MEMKLGGIAARRRAKNPELFKNSNQSPNNDSPKTPTESLRLRLSSNNSSSNVVADAEPTHTPPLTIIPKVAELAFADPKDPNERKRFDEFALNKGKFINTKPFDPNDFDVIRPLGQGIGGVVQAVRHRPTNMILARKMIHLDLKPEQRVQIMRELKIMHECNSTTVIGFFGSFHHNSEINVLMEYMDVGSLESVMLRVHRIPESVCGRILHKGLTGLKYLHNEHKIIHRDVKPSNILVNSAGEVKLCDFGVSGQLEESLLMSFVGTRFYMAPERLEGKKYALQSDIWSLGLTLIEILTGVYPIPPASPPLTADSLPPILKNPVDLLPKKEKPMSVFELLSYIVEEEPPQLSAGIGFSDEAVAFSAICCQKDPADRRDYTYLLAHPWIKNCLAIDVDMCEWALSTLTKSERAALGK